MAIIEIKGRLPKDDPLFCEGVLFYVGPSSEGYESGTGEGPDRHTDPAQEAAEPDTAAYAGLSAEEEQRAEERIAHLIQVFSEGGREALDAQLRRLYPGNSQSERG